MRDYETERKEMGPPPNESALWKRDGLETPDVCTHAESPTMSNNNESLQKRVEEFNHSWGSHTAEESQELINDLSTALQEAEAINEAGFMQPKRCTEDCVNYIGAREDTLHFEAALQLEQEKNRVAVQALADIADPMGICRHVVAKSALIKIEEMEGSDE